MSLKDHLKDTYQKESFDNNHLMLENIINVWAHRFGPESLNELFVKNQDQFKLTEEDQAEENQNQINLELLKNVQYKEEIEFKPKETKTQNNTETIDKDIYGSYKIESEYKDTEELPLPNIKNLRKWINKEKKAS
ncbi:glycoprotein [Prochlorococcus sp.]|jgi:predicted transcriptional regulator|uniref:glycoprotein n=1 Tax=Prochlorococcus sp. TaxID=1220 RepID=UPI003F6A14E8